MYIKYIHSHIIGITDAHDICRLLKPAAEKWYEIGILLKLESTLLVPLKQRCKTDEQRLYTMISAWLQQPSIGKTYTAIVKVLRKKVINEKDVASNIKREIGIQ